MSRPAAADFVDSFFARTLFQPDDGLAATVLSAELAPDAAINKYETRGKADGKVLKQSATTIVKVDEIDGKKLISSIWEAQTVDEE
ncbi:hypothetical protein V866_004704 [Kwoniella sp. B9012]|uniref:Uncharacterized protein n=1 Tax=Kwoniella europaea PYCC6329 TaxID=1423913 RepID=A0AAX4KMR1_9TREE